MHRVVVALVSFIGLVGIAFVAAYLFLFSASTDRAAQLVPAGVAAYANVYLEPSTGQQMNLNGLIGRLPGFADEASLDEKIDQVVQNLLAGAGLDYREQVKPWLGSQVAVAVWPGTGDGDMPAVVIADVRDRAAAESAIERLAAQSDQAPTTEAYEGIDLHVSDDGAYAFVDEMLVAAESADVLREVADVRAGADSLADRDAFRSTMADLPDDHLGSLFVDLRALATTAGAEQELVAVSTAGAALIAETDGLRLSGSAPFDADAAAGASASTFSLGTEPSSLVDWMPNDTIAEVVIFGLRQTLEDAEAAATGTPQGEDVANVLGLVRALAAFGLGVDLDAEILPLLDREVAVAVSGLRADGLPAGQLLLRPDDPDAAAEALERVADGLAANFGAERDEAVVGDVEIVTLTLPDIGEVSYTLTEGIIVIGLGSESVQAAVEAHADGTGLGSSEAYRRTFEVAGERAGNEGWVDVGALVTLLELDAELPEDARDILGQIGTFGFTAPSRDDEIEFHAVLTVEDARPE